MKRVVFLLIPCLIMGILAGCAGQPAASSPALPPVIPAPVSPAVASSTTEDDVIKADDENEAAQSVLDLAASDVVKIKDKMFIAQCNDIFLNPEDYLEKTIVLEGIYKETKNIVTGDIAQTVYRKSPGCCGADGQIGFQFYYDGERPQKNDWVEAVGKVELVDDDYGQIVVLRLSKLTVMDKRGVEFVSN